MQPKTRVLIPFIALAAFAAVLVPSACTKKSTPGSSDGGSDGGGSYDPTQHNTANAIQAGAGDQLLDLPVGTPTAGYAQSPVIGYVPPTDDPGSPYCEIFPATRGVYAPPHAKVLVLDNRDSPTDTQHSRLVLAKIDAVGITDILGERVIQLAQQNLGEDISDELILNGTHSHCAGCRFSRESMVPDIINPMMYPPNYLNALAHGFDTYSQEITDDVAGAIVQALKQALAGLRPAAVGYGEAKNGYISNGQTCTTGADCAMSGGNCSNGVCIEPNQASHDRRCENNHLYGEDFVNHNVGVIRVDDAMTGDPIAVAYNFAQHGTMCNDDNRSLGGDAPAHSEYMVEEQFQKPIVAMFIQGDAADVSPDGRGLSDSQGDQVAGYSVAQTVLQAYGQIKTESVLPLQVHMRWSPVNYDLLGYKPKEFYTDGAILCFELFGAFECPPGGTHAPADVMSQNICMAPAVPGGGKYFTRFATARIGDLAIVTMPGESSTKLGQEIRDQTAAMGFDKTMVIGYALDHMGYLMVDEDWLSGGYEPTITFWGWKFARYAEAQGVDLFQEMMTGVADKKLPATVANMQPDTYTKIAPTDSMTAPAIVQNVAASIPRMTSIEVQFNGGDPGFGTPVATLQVQNGSTWANVTVNGWIPVTNANGYYMATRYAATPTYKAAPKATVRQHLWTVHYEAPPSLPTGTYQISIAGTAQQSGTAAPYTLTTTAFTIVPNTQLTTSGQLVSSGTSIVFDSILMYPQKQPTYAPSPSSDWQLDNFLIYKPQYGNGFSPANAGTTLPTASLTYNSTAEQSVTVTFQTPPGAPVANEYTPGNGPGLHAVIPSMGTGAYELDLPSVTDEFGNSAPASTYAVTAN